MASIFDMPDSSPTPLAPRSSEGDSGDFGQLDLIAAIDRAGKSISPEDREARQRIADLEEKAADLYEKRASRAEWAGLAEQLGRSIAQMGLAQAGARAGTAINPDILPKPTDYGARIEQYGREYERGLTRTGSISKQLGAQIEEKREAEIAPLKLKLGVATRQQAAKERRELAEDLAKGRERANKGERHPYREFGIDQKSGKRISLTIDNYGVKYGPDGAPYHGDTYTYRESSSIGGGIEGQGVYKSLSDRDKGLVDTARNKFFTETREIRDRLGEIGILEDQLALSEKGNQAATQDVGTALATMWQGGQRISDKDVALYLNRPDLEGKVGQIISLASTGKLTPDQYDNFREIASGLTAKNNEILQKRARDILSPIAFSINKSVEELLPSIYQPTEVPRRGAGKQATNAPAAATQIPEAVIQKRMQTLKQSREQATRELEAMRKQSGK